MSAAMGFSMAKFYVPALLAARNAPPAPAKKLLQMTAACAVRKIRRVSGEAFL
jgi:hypothetical protein